MTDGMEYHMEFGDVAPNGRRIITMTGPGLEAVLEVDMTVMPTEVHLGFVLKQLGVGMMIPREKNGRPTNVGAIMDRRELLRPRGPRRRR